MVKHVQLATENYNAFTDKHVFGNSTDQKVLIAIPMGVSVEILCHCNVSSHD